MTAIGPKNDRSKEKLRDEEAEQEEQEGQEEAEEEDAEEEDEEEEEEIPINLSVVSAKPRR